MKSILHGRDGMLGTETDEALDGVALPHAVVLPSVLNDVAVRTERAALPFLKNDNEIKDY